MAINEERQGFSIVDTHEPAIAMPLSPFCLRVIDPYSYKNQILLVGCHQGVRRFVSPCLHHIKSVGSQFAGRCIRRTYVDLVWFVSSESGDDYLPSASLQNGDLGNGGEAVLQDGVQMTDTLSSGAI